MENDEKKKRISTLDKSKLTFELNMPGFIMILPLTADEFEILKTALELKVPIAMPIWANDDEQEVTISSNYDGNMLGVFVCGHLFKSDKTVIL